MIHDGNAMTVAGVLGEGGTGQIVLIRGAGPTARSDQGRYLSGRNTRSGPARTVVGVRRSIAIVAVVGVAGAGRCRDASLSLTIDVGTVGEH